MRFTFLNKDNFKKLIEFEKEARKTEPNTLYGEINQSYERKIFKALIDPQFSNTRTLLAIDDDKIIGRIDVVLLPSFFDGSIRGYIDWIYVLKAYRHHGVAQKLFHHTKQYLKEKQASELFLMVAKNAEAQKFYKSIPNAKISDDKLLSLEL